MKNKLSPVLAFILLSVMNFHFASLYAQGTAITYQGRFNDSGTPYNGNAEFQPTLWNAFADGSLVTSNSPGQVAVSVTNGLFTLSLDFGTNFPGADRWLQLDVRTTLGAFTPLSPRQKLTAAPYAITAGNVTGPVLATQLSGNVLNANLPGSPTFSGTVSASSFSGNGAALSNINAATLGGLSSGNFWQTEGNLGTTPGVDFLGTTDLKALEFKVNGNRALRIQPATSPNLIGGSLTNNITGSSSGSVISGGGSTNVFGSPAPNQIISSEYAMIGGGSGNQIRENSDWSFIGSGFNNRIASNSIYATIPGGALNEATNYGFAAGYRAKAYHTGSFVWADSVNTDFLSTVSNQFRVRATGGMNVVGGGSQPAVHFVGARTGGIFSPVGIAENSQLTGQSAPALRVINNGGDAIDGALSVSANGLGYIATFGNATATVSRLSTNGTWTALAFNPTSDRNAKENFTAINSLEMLQKVVALPLARWNYKSAPGLDHVGPVAQDFHTAFGLNGEDDKHIATVDADGVALAAIQGLNQKLEETRAENQLLRERLSEIEKMLKVKTTRE